MNAPQISIFLTPGEHFVGDARHRVRTLLGSCVSITLWHREQRVGAMSHFLLAERGGLRSSGSQPLDGRYGTEAMQLMLLGLGRMGVAPEQCEAKLFGGGDMFPGHAPTTPPNVGRRNGDAAQELLAEHGIRLVSHSLFGVGHRKIVFDIATGESWAQQTQTKNDPAVSAPTPVGRVDLAARREATASTIASRRQQR